MNGQNSNSSGSSVANVGYFPNGVLQAFVDKVGGIYNGLRKVLAGDSQIGAVDFTPALDDDKVADAVMEEIARRLVVTIEKAAEGNVVFQPTPPEDKSKVWWQTDPVSGIPLGTPKTWNASAGAWLPIAANGVQYVPPRRRNGLLQFPAGASEQNYNFTDLGTTDYIVTATPTTFINGGFAPAPGTFPSHFGMVVSGKSNNQVTIAAFGVPAGGITYEIDIEERLPTTG